jgi:hypothetical protein
MWGDASLTVQILSLPTSLSLSDPRTLPVGGPIHCHRPWMHEPPISCGSMGRVKLEMKKMENMSGQHITYSKRHRGRGADGGGRAPTVEDAAPMVEDVAVEAEAPAVEDGVLLDRALSGASKQRPEYPRQRRPVVAAGALGAR